ncbi:hypothetical protein BC834DRAFT_678462 [Gloeopeniophorella convolvens]|nr:hypothetical protein BC834DRAFT_678462 [Gloeopeniophorella convolvens]
MHPARTPAPESPVGRHFPPGAASLGELAAGHRRPAAAHLSWPSAGPPPGLSSFAAACAAPAGSRCFSTRVVAPRLLSPLSVAGERRWMDELKDQSASRVGAARLQHLCGMAPSLPSSCGCVLSSCFITDRGRDSPAKSVHVAHVDEPINGRTGPAVASHASARALRDTVVSGVAQHASVPTNMAPPTHPIGGLHSNVILDLPHCSALSCHTIWQSSRLCHFISLVQGCNVPSKQRARQEISLSKRSAGGRAGE